VGGRELEPGFDTFSLEPADIGPGAFSCTSTCAEPGPVALSNAWRHLLPRLVGIDGIQRWRDRQLQRHQLQGQLVDAGQ